jgi:hypothetical protein
MDSPGLYYQWKNFFFCDRRAYGVFNVHIVGKQGAYRGGFGVIIYQFGDIARAE